MELFRALGSLIEPPAAQHRPIADSLGLTGLPGASDYEAHIAFQRYPYASVYLGPEGMMGGEARARISGFWSALRLDVPPESDHLAALLSLLASIDGWEEEEGDPAQKKLLAEARVTLVWEHLTSWLHPYLLTFDDVQHGFYRSWATLLKRAVAELLERLDLPGYLPAALSEAPPLADPRPGDGSSPLLGALLAPVRSGVILLRGDLAAFGEEAGLAHRAGERRYGLSAFLAQDPAATLEWLVAFATRWQARHSGSGPDPVSLWWSDRAGRTATLLGELAADAEAVMAPGGGS